MLALVLPDEQVRAMRDAGPAPAWTPGTRAGAPGPVTDAASFLEAAHALPRWRSLAVEFGGSRIALQRSGAKEES